MLCCAALNSNVLYCMGEKVEGQNKPNVGLYSAIMAGPLIRIYRGIGYSTVGGFVGGETLNFPQAHKLAGLEGCLRGNHDEATVTLAAKRQGHKHRP